MKFKMNPNFEKELAKMAAPAMAELAQKRTKQYGALIAKHKGGDIELVKSELQRLYKVDGGHLADPELSQHAAAIVSGQRIVFESAE